MALFGSKKKADAAPVKGATTDSGAAPTAPARVVKEKKARPTKGAIKNGTVVGLNIGNSTIKAVEVTAKNGELSVTRLATIATPPEAFQNGNVLSASGLSNALKALWKAGGFKSRAVISSVAGTGALVVRVIEVPFMSDSQLADAMRADAQLYIPFPPTEVQMDFKALRELPTDPDSGTMDVLLAAAQSEVIDAHIKVLQTARLDPRAVDVEPIAAGRTLSLQKRGELNGLMVDYNEITAIANIGALGTEISLLRGDVLVFTRTVTTGGNSISQGIADSLGVPFVEGERIKIEQGDALPPEGYQTHQADDDFGFGDTNSQFGDANATFGGGEFDDFGLGEPSATAGAATNRTTVLDTPTTASTDPFDLDFFNQGPKNEPGGGHAQKENQPNPLGKPAANIAFDEDDLSLLPGSTVPAPAGAPPTAAAASPVAFNFDFEPPAEDLPSAKAAQTAATPVVPLATVPVTPAVTPFDSGGAQDLPLEMLPSVDTASAVPAAAAPTPVAPTAEAGRPMGSAFDFSDFDLPATAQAGGADLAGTAPIGPARLTPASSAPAEVAGLGQNAGFAFDDLSDLTPSVAGPTATLPVSSAVPDALPASSSVGATTAAAAGGAALGAVAGAAAVAAGVAATSVASPLATGSADNAFANMGVPVVESTSAQTTASPVATSFFEAPRTAAAEGAFDMGDIFGSTEASGHALTPVDAGGVSFEDLNLGDAPSAGLNVGGVGGVDDFAFGVDGEDFGGFGAGLSAGANAEGAAVYEALAQPIEELASEISRSLSFYLERVPDAALSRIYLTGGGALLKNLDVFLTGRLGAPTAVLNPLQLLPVAARSEMPNGPLYTVALGLALRDFVD